MAVQRVAQRVGDTAEAARDVGTRVLDGDRPLVVSLLVLVGMCLVMLSGPLQSYWDGHGRVELLERKQEALAAEIERLEDRREALQDPTQIELLAREEQGFIRPGEVPFVVVPPEADEASIARPGAVDAPDAPWYRRAWERVAALFD